MVKKKNKEESVEKKIKKEIKKMNTPKKKNRITKKEENQILNEPFLEDIKTIKEKNNKKLLKNIELIVIVLFSLIMLVLLCNRTFFRNNYKNSKININIPLLMYFKEDKDNKIVLKTLRKTKYLQEYFNDELSTLTQYNCGNYTFYYDEVNYFAIYDIKINKNIISKTVTIEYAAGDASCLCNAGVTGIEAEKLCSK